MFPIFPVWYVPYFTFARGTSAARSYVSPVLGSISYLSVIRVGETILSGFVSILFPWSITLFKHKEKVRREHQILWIWLYSTRILFASELCR